MNSFAYLALPVLLTSLAASAQTSELQTALQRCRVQTDAVQRLACYDALVPLGWGAPIASVTAAASAAPTSAAPVAQFGLPQSQRADVLQVVESHIAGAFMGWRPKSRIQLGNGQVWEIADGTEASYDLRNPKVKVRRGMLGSYFLEIEGASATPKVRRIR